jgi:hypothetical protein
MVESVKDEAEDNAPESIVTEAKERFKRAEEAYSASRKQSVADTKFAFGDSDNGYQWNVDTLQSRQNDKRVCLTINLTAQHCNQIINQIRQNRPACKVSPSDDKADKKTAEILSGLIRNIQANSAADNAHDLAAEHSIYGGEGFWRVLTEYESETSFDQVILIKPIANPNLVYIDPDAKELDKSDARWGFIFEDLNKETFKREHPELKDEPQAWEGTEDKWVSDDTFRRAEYFWCEDVKDKAILLADGSTVLESDLLGQIPIDQMGQPIPIIKERDTTRKQWYWCKLVGGHKEPIDKREWAGKYIPIISVVGKEINIDGEIIRKGIVRDLKDPARMVNYAYSETIQAVALQNKIPYLAAAEAIEGYEDEWGRANTSNMAYLPYNAYDEAGNPIPAPVRQPPAVMPAAQIQLLQLSTEEMRGASGQQNSNFGIKSEASSGVGIQRLKQQGEIATFHFPDNLARGLRYEAIVLIDLIQKVYDTKRVVRVLGLDGRQEHAVLDPQHPLTYSEQDIGEEDIQRIFNPTVGRYDVVIDTGPSFQTQRQEAFASLTQLAGQDPAFMQVAGDIIMRAADFPMADQLAARLEKMLPPNLQEQKGGAQQEVAQLRQQTQQMGQQLQLMQQALQEAQQRLHIAESGQAKTQLEIQAKMRIAEVDAQLAEEKLQREIEAKQRMIVMEEQFRRDQANIDAVVAMDKAKQDDALLREKIILEAHLALEKAKIDNETKEDIAELQAYVDLQKIGRENANLTADVNSDIAKDAPLPKILRRKISMTAPSGGVYTGTIEDVGGE